MSIGATKSRMVFSVAALLISIFFWSIWNGTRTRNPTTVPPPATAKVRLVEHDNPLRHSCVHCGKITIRFPPGWPKEGDSFHVRLDHTIADVRQAAADGCQLFKDLEAGYESVNNWYFHVRVCESIFRVRHSVHIFTGCKTFWERAAYFFHGISDRPFYIRIGRLDREAGGTLFARLLFAYWKSFELDLTADQSDHAAKFILERPLSHNVASNESFLQARQWLEECLIGGSEHDRCRSEESPFAPTRLIEIRHLPDGSLIPRIYRTERNGCVKWACLSYCWGGDQPVKTTKAKLNSRVSLLPFPELPKTLQDALIVTDQLGLRFIWIDSLCIIQDDLDDVAREISQMPEIYKYGVCTVSASRASNSEEGFLQPHQIEQSHHRPTVLKVQCPDGQPGWINLGYRGAEYRYQPEPIHSRSWCFQERLLSPRILDYGSTQLRWTCLSKVDVDGGKANLAAATDGLIGRSLEGLDEQGLDSLWRNTVTAYTRRNLSFAGDKLVAMSAVASEFSPRYNDDYLAGLWRKSLCHQLLWRAGRPRYTRPRVYIAPSWSWASVQDRVDGEVDIDSRPSMRIVDCQVQLTHSYAPFGSVTGGFVLLECQLQEAVWYPDSEEVTLQTGSELLRFMASREALETRGRDFKTRFLGWVSADAVEDGWSTTPGFSVKVHCMKIWERGEKRGTRCLFLLPTDKSSSSYRRIAYFEMGDARYRYEPPIDRDFFAGADTEVIKIV